MTARGGGRDGAPGHEGEPSVLEGDALARSLAEALDYRGDVTLVLDDGSTLSGYVFDLAGDRARPDVRLYAADADAAPMRMPSSRIRGVAFSGRDMADGRSWEAWVKRHEEKKRLLAEGVDIGDIEPQPESLG